MLKDRDSRAVFDAVALDYDEARPGYPEALIEDVIALSGIPPGGSILEIGCGPGKATLPFARRGYSMLCLELGESLAALAAERCRPYPQVEIQHVAFEEWPLREKSFDLVLSAQALHWIDPEIRYVKAAAALRKTGALAILWNHSPGEDSPFRRAATEIHRAVAPELLEFLPGQQSAEELIAETVQEINASGLFRKVEIRQYPWSESYTAERYVKLLNTYGRIRNLEPDVRQKLLAGIKGVVERFGGTVENKNTSLLYVARVKA
jgi:ubiquinone/menaquinone biosynthesis C-methylase UbiE